MKKKKPTIKNPARPPKVAPAPPPIKTFKAAEPLVLPNTYFDGRWFWHKHPKNRWESLGVESATRLLRVDYGLVNLRPQSGASVIDQTLRAVEVQHRIAAGAPFVHDSRDIVDYRGETYVNTSTVTPVQPAESGDPAKFPWLHEFYQKKWADPVETQRDYFFAWFQRFYATALAGKMLPGQNAIIAGPVDQGKTFESRRILGAALGGTASAASFLKGKTVFNAECARFALWTMDDEEGNFSWEERMTFSNSLKSAAANQEVRCEPKFMNAFTIPWFGRVWLTCNLDPRSLKIIPDLKGGIIDKLMIFKNGPWLPLFLEREANEQRITDELPHFLRWILDWKAPAYVISERARYGVRPYAHPELVQFSHESSSENRLCEILAEVARQLDEGRWFTATSLRAHIGKDHSYGPDMREFSRDRLREGLLSPEAKRYVKGMRSHAGNQEFFITGKTGDLPPETGNPDFKKA